MEMVTHMLVCMVLTPCVLLVQTYLEPHDSNRFSRTSLSTILPLWFRSGTISSVCTTSLSLRER